MTTQARSLRRNSYRTTRVPARVRRATSIRAPSRRFLAAAARMAERDSDAMPSRKEAGDPTARYASFARITFHASSAITRWSGPPATFSTMGAQCCSGISTATVRRSPALSMLMTSSGCGSIAHRSRRLRWDPLRIAREHDRIDPFSPRSIIDHLQEGFARRERHLARLPPLEPPRSGARGVRGLEKNALHAEPEGAALPASLHGTCPHLKGPGALEPDTEHGTASGGRALRSRRQVAGAREAGDIAQTLPRSDHVLRLEEL